MTPRFPDPPPVLPRAVAFAALLLLAAAGCTEAGDHAPRGPGPHVPGALACGSDPSHRERPRPPF